MSAPAVDLLPGRTMTEFRTSQPHALAEQIPGELTALRHGKISGWGLTSLGVACLKRLVSAPDLLLQDARVWLKDQPGHRVALVESTSDTVPGPWCCKETVSRSWWVRCVTSWGAFRAYNAFRQGQALLRIQVRTPCPLAVLSFARRGAYHEYLLSEAVPAAISLQGWLSAAVVPTSRIEVQQRHEVIRQLALQLRRLHCYGFDHRDLKPTNILISDQAATLNVWVIDLDGVWRWPMLPQPRRVQNLARLWAGVALLPHVTSIDALRFLAQYLTAAQKKHWKVLWGQVQRRSAAKIARQRLLNARQQTAELALTSPGSNHRI